MIWEIQAVNINPICDEFELHVFETWNTDEMWVEYYRLLADRDYRICFVKYRRPSVWESESRNSLLKDIEGRH
jgi:hypothetical protein